MNKTLISLLALVVAACAPPAPDQSKKAAAVADPAETASVDGGEAQIAAVRAAIKAQTPELNPDQIHATPMPGVYEIQVGLNFGYVTADGRYLIAGDLTDLKTRRSVTEERRRGARLALLDRVDKGGFIEFAPESLPAKYTVTVFTDVDCGYCRMLHSQIKDYNARGIAVRYLFFPRTGPDTESFYKAETVWCSADRKAALTEAKTGAPVKGDKSCVNPVMTQLQAAAALGLRGTPAIVMPDGELVSGYHPPDELLQMLQAASTKFPAAG